MSDRPIIFSGPMVRALLEGRKTQTRRRAYERSAQAMGAPGVTSEVRMSPWARLEPGDRLWVREAWRADRCIDHKAPRDMPSGGGDWTSVRYEADGYGPGVLDPGRFRQAMHMPRWAYRITLIVTDVRIERLQDISEADAIAEGIERDAETGAFWGADGEGVGGHTRRYTYAVDAFRDLWDGLHGPGAWDANPWVAAISFRSVLGNIDHIGGDDE